jgi:hypothetical protein
MLADFQQALADLTASPEFCNAVRRDPAALPPRYALTERERARLLGIVRHPGMACACTVYRMKRLAPLSMNLRGTLKALGAELRPLLAQYWLDHPHGRAHFLLESDQFAGWLSRRLDAGVPVPAGAREQLIAEAKLLRAALEASYTETRSIRAVAPISSPL